MQRLLAAALLVCLSVAPAAAEPEAPRLVRAEDGLALVGLPAVLDDPEIRRQLDSGLTTTFLVSVEARVGGQVLRGGARVQVRFEPWDEIYEVAARGADLQSTRATLESFAALRRRWRDLRLVVLPAPQARSLRGAPRLRVDLEVIPFSQKEQREAQRWFSESMDEAQGGGAEGAGASSEDRSRALSEVLDLLLATSIQRRPLVAWRWQVVAEAAR